MPTNLSHHRYERKAFHQNLPFTSLQRKEHTKSRILHKKPVLPLSGCLVVKANFLNSVLNQYQNLREDCDGPSRPSLSSGPRTIFNRESVHGICFLSKMVLYLV